MRRTLGSPFVSLLASAGLVLALAACSGEDSDDAGTATDPTSTSAPAEEPAEEPTDEPTLDTGLAYDVVAIEHATAAGGTLDDTLVRVDDAQDRQAFTAQFRTPDLRDDVREAVSDARRSGASDGDLYAAVVAIGCDVPPGVEVTDAGDGELRVMAQKVKDPLPECLAPVTTVAVVSVSR